MSFFESEKFNSFIEVVIAVILGAGAVLGAYSAFQSSLYGSKMDQSYNIALQEYSDAGTAYTNAIGEMITDSIAFLEIRKNQLAQQYDPSREEYYDYIASDVLPYITNETLADAMNWADEQNEKDPEYTGNNGQPYSFYDYEAYGKASSEWYSEAVGTAMDRFEEGNKYNTLGDYHAQYSALFAIALFLTGLSAVLKKPKVRFALNVLSAVILIVTGILAFQIPIVMP